MLKTTSLVNAVPFTLGTAVRHHRNRNPTVQADSAADRGLHLVFGDHLHSDGAAVSLGEAFRQGLRCATGRRAWQAAAAAGQTEGEPKDDIAKQNEATFAGMTA